MLESLAALWARGYPVDWARRFPDGGRVVSLPGYPWQRERFWFEANRTRPAHVERRAIHSWRRTSRWRAPAPRRALGRRRLRRPITPVWPWATRDAVDQRRGCHAIAERRRPGRARSLHARGRALSGRAQARGRRGKGAARRAAGRGGAGGSALRPPDPRGRVDDDRQRRPACPDRRVMVPSVRRHDVDAIQARSDELDLDGHRRLVSARPSPAARRAARRGWRGARSPSRRRRPPSVCIHPEALEAGLRVLVTAARCLGRGSRRAGSSPPSALSASTLALADAVWVYAVAADAVTTHLGDVCFLDATGAAVLELHGVQISRPSRGRRGSPPSGRMAATAARRPARCAAAARWLVVADPATYVTELVARLQAAGDTCVVLSSAQALDGARRRGPRLGAPRHGMRPSGERRRGSGRVADRARAPPTSGWASALAVVHALAAGTDGSPPRLWLVTRGAQRVTPADASVSLGAAAVWGLGAAIAYEHPALRSTRVDLPLVSPRSTRPRSPTSCWAPMPRTRSRCAERPDTRRGWSAGRRPPWRRAPRCPSRRMAPT